MDMVQCKEQMSVSVDIVRMWWCSRSRKKLCIFNLTFVYCV